MIKAKPVSLTNAETGQPYVGLGPWLLHQAKRRGVDRQTRIINRCRTLQIKAYIRSLNRNYS